MIWIASFHTIPWNEDLYDGYYSRIWSKFYSFFCPCYHWIFIILGLGNRIYDFIIVLLFYKCLIQVCTDDCLFMEAFDNMLKAWTTVLGDYQLFPENFCQESCLQIFNTYLQSHLSPPDGARRVVSFFTVILHLKNIFKNNNYLLWSKTKTVSLLEFYKLPNIVLNLDKAAHLKLLYAVTLYCMFSLFAFIKQFIDLSFVFFQFVPPLTHAPNIVLPQLSSKHCFAVFILPDAALRLV